jgi:L-aspartate oxidase
VDFLVIGSGVAGLRAALGMAEHGRVAMLTKGNPLESSSIYAQGGVAVALSEEDDVAIHLRDTLQAGHGLCRREAVRVLVEEGPERIRELIAWGAVFDKVGGQFAFAKEAAHSRSRILRARGDATGNEIVRALMGQARRHKNIQWFEHHFTVDVLVREGVCCGAVVLDESTGTRFAMAAQAVVLATGGIGQVYARTTNPPSATGDGMAMAYRAGAVLEDMEFVQFHPTALFLPSAPPFLLSEAIRGEGGQLRNIKGELFMQRYHQDGALAPRDIVARAIWSEMAATKARHVYLDVTHLSPTFTKQRFPTIYSTCLRYDIDMTEEWIPVSPSAHYIMGGVKTDVHGATTLTGLYAAGEVACSGVHGANRLASNSLLEGLVFGKRAAESAAAWALQRGRATVPKEFLRAAVECPTKPLEDVEKLRSSLRRLLWGRVGVVRSGESLSKAVAQLIRWKHLVDGSFGTRLELEVKNMVEVGLCIAEAALGRDNSVGAHWRADFPGGSKAQITRHSETRAEEPVSSADAKRPLRRRTTRRR